MKNNANNRIDVNKNQAEETFNETTKKAIAEGKELLQDGNAKGYSSLEELKKTLDVWQTKNGVAFLQGHAFFFCDYLKYFAAASNIRML